MGSGGLLPGAAGSVSANIIRLAQRSRTGARHSWRVGGGVFSQGPSVCGKRRKMLAWHLVGAFRRWHHQVKAMLPTHNETDAGTTDTSARCGVAQQGVAADEARNLVGSRPRRPYLLLSRASQLNAGVRPHSERHR
jgi:hypothetical protein